MVYLYEYRLREGEKPESLPYLRDAVKRAVPEAGGEIGIYKDEKGKPVTDLPGVYVSATHTGRLVLCAVASEPVGIDAQLPKEGLNCGRIAARFFTEEEAALVEAAGEEAFYPIWCRKEAYSKLVGEGIAYGLKNIPTVKDGIFASAVAGSRIIGGLRGRMYFACAGGNGELVWTEIQE